MHFDTTRGTRPRSSWLLSCVAPWFRAALFGAGLGLCLAIAAPAAAQFQARNPNAYPQRFTDRPLTLPQLHLSGNVTFAVVDFGGSDSLKFLFGGVSLGVTDDLEFGLGPSPIAPAGTTGFGPAFGLGGEIAPDTNGLASPYVYGRYRLTDGNAQVGLELGAQLPTRDTNGGAVHFGLPLRALVTDGFALDASLGFTVFIFDDFSGGRDTEAAMTLTISPRFGNRELFGGFDTGVFLFLDDPDSVSIPLGFEAGATLGAGRAAVLDLVGRFSFPLLFLVGDDSDVVTDVWRLDVIVRATFGFSG